MEVNSLSRLAVLTAFLIAAGCFQSEAEDTSDKSSENSDVASSGATVTAPSEEVNNANNQQATTPREEPTEDDAPSSAIDAAYFVGTWCNTRFFSNGGDNRINRTHIFKEDGALHFYFGPDPEEGNPGTWSVEGEFFRVSPTIPEMYDLKIKSTSDAEFVLGAIWGDLGEVGEYYFTRGACE